MIKITQELSKEIGELLAGYRKKSHLTQAEIALRLGLSQKSGVITISRLEKGKFKNLSLDLILNYLTICEKPWPAFFEKLASIYFKKKHDKIMAQIPTNKYYKKIDRDVAKFTHSIETKFSEKQKIKPLTQAKKEKMAIRYGKHRINIEPIEQEITKLLGETQVPIILNQFYKAFAREYYSVLQQDLETPIVNQKLNRLMEKWVKKGLSSEFLEKVKEIVMGHLSVKNSADS
ncbi:MAG: helix-turn-helix transcriptional regulator [candidate division WOR-3 bacterium]